MKVVAKINLVLSGKKIVSKKNRSSKYKSSVESKKKTFFDLFRSNVSSIIKSINSKNIQKVLQKKKELILNSTITKPKKDKKNKNTKYIFLEILLLTFTSLGLFIYLLRDLPSPRRLTNTDNYAVSTQIFDRNHKLLYEIFADENRTPIKLSSLPPYVYQASIAIEDKKFYSHFGFDIFGIVRAIKSNITGGRLEGGSTITQQLVKNALLTREKSIQRKIKEGILAIFTEALYTKEEILEMYLNYISYGGTSVGIEAAANSYFDKNASQLTLAEAALLAGLPQAPTRYSPFGSNPVAAKNRQVEVLRRMQEDDYITKIEAQQAESEVLNFALSKIDINAPHFVFYVRDLLYEKYGVETVERGGLRVTTTLDLDLHNVAQASLSAEVERLERYQVGNGAALIIKPDTGEILSMIGSKDYFNATDEGQVNVTLADRQPGSSIKPIMYATTFQEKTLNPGTILIDSPTCFASPGQKPYCPKNYDGSFKGPVTIRSAIGNSRNIPAVKGLRTIGVETFITQANKMGLTSWTDPSRYGLSLTLGGGEVKMINLAQAFSVLANEGIKTPITPFIKIEDFRGNILMEENFEQRKKDLQTLTEFDGEESLGEITRVMDRAPAYMTSHIMQDNNARVQAFGSNSELVIPGKIVSVKTGTTNDLKDNWTVGFTPEYLVITWVGNNDNTSMNQNVVSGVTGAAPIFNDIMSLILKDHDYEWQTKPEDVLWAGVCASGFPPGKSQAYNESGEAIALTNSESYCSITSTDLYWEAGLPSNSKKITKEVWIDPTTGLPPEFGQQVSGLVLENRTIYVDPVTKIYCADCNRPMTEDGKIIYEKNTVQENLY
ncbi:transglycosylase domain-containing protein [Patescibacteria group bacterium]|nr:transglycosylase domain-containing protein [Patescibacteria group bacterium]